MSKVSKKNSTSRDGKLYYSEATAAKILEMTKPALKNIIISEQLEWCNFRENGPIWITASSINSYLKQKLQTK